MKTKRLLAALLTLVMLLGMLPTGSLAAARIETDELPGVPVTEENADSLWTDAPAKDSSEAQLAEVDLTTLTNIATKATLSHSEEMTGTWLDNIDDAKNLVNGNYDDQFRWINTNVKNYINAKGVEPSVTLSFDGNQSIGAIKVGFLKKDSEGTHTYPYHILGKAEGETEFRELFSGEASKASDNCVKSHTFPALTELSEIQVAFKDQDGDYWPILAEIEVLAQLPPLDLTALTNIAKGMSPTLSNAERNQMSDKANLTDDNNDTEFEIYGNWLPSDTAVTADSALCYMDFDFGQNRSIGGFELAVTKGLEGQSYHFSYNIYGKVAESNQWTPLVENCQMLHEVGKNVQTHPLGVMSEMRYVRVVLYNGNQYGALSEFRIFGTEETTPGEDDLIEVAALSEITVPSNEGTANKIVDGNIATQWAAGSGSWPADVDFALPGNMLVKRVEVDFERFDGRTFDLAVSRAVNNVTSDYEQLARQNGHSVAQTYVLDLPEAQRMTHVRVSLLGTNADAWPALAEVRIYAVDETIDFNNYQDITPHATPSSGDSYKEWNFHGNQQVVGFRAALADGASAKVLGKMKRDTNWTTYFAQLQNGDNVFQFPAGISVVRVELSDPAQLTDFQIFGTYAEPLTDFDSVAFDKPTHSNFNAATAYLINDGDTTTSWKADMYPVYVDIDLEENYNINEIQLFLPKNSQTEYTLYTSMDGRDFTFLDESHPMGDHVHNSTTIQGFTSVEARIVRVYLEYYNQSDKPVLNEVRVLGTPSGTDIQPTPEVTVEDFANTAYAAQITNADVISEVQGIISRQVGSNYVNWFDFALADQSNGYDYFTLENAGGKIKVTGNNGVSLATGINHYLKYYCNVNISQVGNQANMPADIVPLDASIHKETKYPVRYAYNYCTHSYSMAFWGEDEWRNELDWLALNGVNVVLDITGQEEVWREFLMSVGYTHEEAKDFLAGPGYYAWAYMANLTGFGGPIHDSFLTERVELGRQNQRIMRTLGMEPVLQAFSGMVPVDITTHDPNAAVIAQGVWCSFQRPTMLKTDTATYDEYAAKFYAAQKRVFGDAKYYATDPFHEGGNTGGMSGTTVASELLDSLIDFDSDAVWVIQSWQGNPTTALLAGLRAGSNPTRVDRRDHALVLDLWAEHSPHNNEYGEDTDGDGIKEFSDTPWVWCMLNNFGGRMGLHGHLDALQKGIPAAANNRKHMAGIGISPEGSQENPLLYDFLFETIWTDDADQPLAEIDLDQWLIDYARRRYGAKSESAEQALAILSQTVYKSSLNMVGQGAPESVINGRPSLAGGKASTWGSGTISYSKSELERAAQLLLADYDTLSASDAYLYDVADVLKQHLSNYAQNLHSQMAAAYQAGNVDEFDAFSTQFLALMDTLEQVLSTRKEFLLGTWTTNASEMAQNADDFTKRLYLRNAKALVTTWGSINQCNGGGLKDYSNRQWAGLTKDFYKARWIIWIDQAKENLANGITDNFDGSFDWFALEWAYARNHGVTYSNQPDTTLSLKALGADILENYSVRDPLGERDIDPATMVLKTGTEETSSENGAAANVLDRDTSSIWHSNYSGTTPTATDKWIALDLGKATPIDSLRYLPRQGGGANGIITGYKVLVSNNDAAWADPTDESKWIEVASGTWANDRTWKTAVFTAPTVARYVKFLCTAGSNGFATASEIRITSTDPIAISGTIPIDGDAKFGSLLTARKNQIIPDAAKSFLSFQWYRDGVAIPGATEETYTPVAEDITHAITVTVTASEPYTGSITSDSVTIAKADGLAMKATPTHVDASEEDAADGKITGLFKGRAYEYCLWDISANQPAAGNDWKDFSDLTGDETASEDNYGTAEITGLVPGSYVVRRAETATHTAGPISKTVTISFSGSGKFPLNNPHDFEGGVVQAGRTQIPAQDTVRLRVTPNEGYELTSLTVTLNDADSTVITPLQSADDPALYTFTMPACGVTVNASFTRKTYHVTHSLTHLNCNMGEQEHTVAHGDKPEIILTAASGYALPRPAEVTVTKKSDGEQVFGYTCTRVDATIVIHFDAGVTQDLEVTGTGNLITYPIAYDLDGGILGESDINPASYTVESDAFTLHNPTKEGFVFSGWTGTGLTRATTTVTVAAGSTGDRSYTATWRTPSSSGSSSSSSSTPPTTTTTETNPDGSTTTTITDNRTGVVTETTKKEDGTVAVVETKPDGTKTETVTQPDGAATEKVTDAEENVTITVTDAEGEELAKVEIPAAIPAPEATFVDVSDIPWAETAINNVAGLKLVEGVGGNKYDPIAPMTRGALATVLHRLSSSKQVDLTSEFADVDRNGWYAESAAWAAKTGVVQGIQGDGQLLFWPNDVITREQLAVMMARYAKLIGLDVSADKAVLNAFTDGEKTGSWAVDGVAWCVEKGILLGKGNNTLDPNAQVTRAEVAVMLDRFIDLIK